MRAAAEVRIPVRSAAGAVTGHLCIALLPKVPGALPSPLVEVLDDDAQDATAPVQLLEGHEYRYEWLGLSELATSIVTDPEEMFQPDTLDGMQGRLRPALSTGTVCVEVRSGQTPLGQLEFEVRSRKLSYLSEYQWMLSDIAEQMTELVMDRFAASATSFAVEGARDAVTLYQRFAFMRTLLSSGSFQSALSEIIRRPHVAWEERLEAVAVGQPIRASAHTIRQLSMPGARTPWPRGPIESLRSRIERRRTEATHDTTPNRFVRFALERWRQVVSDIDRLLGADATNVVVARGRREIARTLEDLDVLLHHDLFKDLGPLGRFPADDQVLHRREGYRDVFRAYLEFELAARLSWSGAESSYSAGQRDVATLYEYWAFLQLAHLVAGLAGENFDLAPLVETRRDGLNVVLKAGKETVLQGTVERAGRRLAIELCFNRTFSGGTESLGSWTRPMRPDCSLIISPSIDEPAAFEPVVLHFDAKYRVNFAAELFGRAGDLVDVDESVTPTDELRRGSVVRADLLKMHAYRDAIRRSAGAYVLYPGEDSQVSRENFKEYHELLPGLGAFILRPTQLGDPDGFVPLRQFLEDVFDHVATRLTNHERGRYWLEEVYGGQGIRTARHATLSFGPPGPETTVLLGYVKNDEHWKWIRRNKAYNVRTLGRRGGVALDASLLYCQLLLLYCIEDDEVALARIVSDPELVELAAMEATGYPNPSSDYLCVQLSWAANQGHARPFRSEAIDRIVQNLGKLKGEPVAVRWKDLERLLLSRSS